MIEHANIDPLVLKKQLDHPDLVARPVLQLAERKEQRRLSSLSRLLVDINRLVA